MKSFLTLFLLSEAMTFLEGHYKHIIFLQLCFVAASCVCPRYSLPYNDNCYLFVSQHVAFFEAEVFCNNQSDELGESHLVSISDDDEMNFVSKTSKDLMGETEVWIGLHDVVTEGVFVWTDGSNKTYMNFSPGEPSNSANREHCVHTYNTEAWNDVACYVTKPFVCKREQWQWVNECS